MHWNGSSTAPRRRMRLTDWVLRGAGDYAQANAQANRPASGTPEEAVYLDGWRAAALDDANRRARKATEARP